ncbi:MAG: hypothetical protein ACR2ID_00925 [Chthoniobacterales bacterium]
MKAAAGRDRDLLAEYLLERVVSRPKGALDCFWRTKMDVLVRRNLFIEQR